MLPLPERTLNRLRSFCRHNLIPAHLAGMEEAHDARWPARAERHDPASVRALSRRNRPSAMLGEAGMLLATTASLYLLIAILVGIFTASP